jgi:hypothetical protein
MGKRLFFNQEARRLLQAGVDELAISPRAPPNVETAEGTAALLLPDDLVSSRESER